MSTQCTDDVFSYPLPGSRGKRRIDVDFSGGTLTSDGVSCCSAWRMSDWI